MKIDYHDLVKDEVFIIAELSANHGNSLDIAKKTIKAAKACGANAIKLQTYTPDSMTIDSKRKDFTIKGTIWEGRNLYELYKEASTPYDWHEELFYYAKEIGIICFSTPFDIFSVDFLESHNVPAYKIASFEITDIPLIEYIASKGKPIFLSTGVATKNDIELALKTIRNQGNQQIILLKCVSSYPAPLEEANLLMIDDFSKRFNVISGLSDHTIGIIAPIVATSLGARVIEKHFILDNSIGGPDASFSLDKKGFSKMVNAVRNAESAIGKVNYSLTPNQVKGRDFTRSLYAVKNIKKGDLFTSENIRSIRPGYGLHPKYKSRLIGSKSPKSYKPGDRLCNSTFNFNKD